MEENKVYIVKPNILESMEGMMFLFMKGIDKYFSDKELFNFDTYNIFQYDESLLETYIDDSFVPTMYLVIDNPENYKKKDAVKSNIVSAPELFLTLSNIKAGIMNELIGLSEENLVYYKDKYFITVKHNFTYSENDEDVEGNFTYRIIPSLKYTNDFGQSGVMYYNDNLKEIRIEYPTQSQVNFLMRDFDLKGRLIEIVKRAKTDFMNADETKNLPSEVFETMFYNVPDNFFEEDLDKSLKNILNYLRNKPMNEYKSMDEQTEAFSSQYKPMSFLYVKYVIKQLEQYYKNNK